MNTEEILANNQHLSFANREKLKLWWEKVLRPEAGEQVVEDTVEEAE